MQCHCEAGHRFQGLRTSTWGFKGGYHASWPVGRRHAGSCNAAPPALPLHTPPVALVSRLLLQRPLRLAAPKRWGSLHQRCEGAWGWAVGWCSGRERMRAHAPPAARCPAARRALAPRLAQKLTHQQEAGHRIFSLPQNWSGWHDRVCLRSGTNQAECLSGKGPQGCRAVAQSSTPPTCPPGTDPCPPTVPIALAELCTVGKAKSKVLQDRHTGSDSPPCKQTASLRHCA